MGWVFLDSLLPSLPTLLVLDALEEGPAHGYQIARRVEAESDGVLTLKEGTLYPQLYKLESRGLIVGHWQDEMAGRRVRVYELTPDGRAELATGRAEWFRKAGAVGRALRTEGGAVNAAS